MKRFWNKVDIKGINDCWNWKASTVSRGYGSFKLNRTTKLAHRVAYELSFGPIPNKLYCLHKCDNILCINPTHLYIGTQGDNMWDREKRCNYDRNTCGNPKLYEGEVWLIRKIYSETSLSHRKIAPMFRVSKGTIWSITKKDSNYIPKDSKCHAHM